MTKKLLRCCAGCGTPIAARGAYYCVLCKPARRCVRCGQGIEGRTRNATTCVPCSLARRMERKGGGRLGRCVKCAQPITGRGARAIYCSPCAEREADRQNRESTWMSRYGAADVARDLDLERRIEQHLAHIRASRRYTITPEIVWARRVDPVSAEAQDVAGASLCLATEKRTNRESRAKRLLAAERRAVAADEQGAA